MIVMPRFCDSVYDSVFLLHAVLQSVHEHQQQQQQQRSSIGVCVFLEERNGSTCAETMHMPSMYAYFDIHISKFKVNFEAGFSALIIRFIFCPLLTERNHGTAVFVFYKKMKICIVTLQLLLLRAFYACTTSAGAAVHLPSVRPDSSS